MSEQNQPSDDAKPGLTREAILAQSGRLKREAVNVPEWGGRVWVREMNGTERDQWDDWIVRVSAAGTKRVDDLRAHLIARTACDQDGKRLFRDEDVETIAGLGGASLTRLTVVAQRLSGLVPEALSDLAGN